MKDITLEIRIEGNQFSCNIQGYDDLQNDPFGFGDNPKEAVEDLLTQLNDHLEI